MQENYTLTQPFVLESGKTINGLTIAYNTYGTLNAAKNNVIWICHALTANSDPVNWWPGFVGENMPIDIEKYFVVCANIIGSCYGSTGPLSRMDNSNEFYYSRFPQITIRDMVNAHIALSNHLNLQNIQLLIGGSMGGYQALEWTCMQPDRIESLFLLATSAAESTWGRAIHTAQRIAIEADPTWKNLSGHAGAAGLKAARAIGMLTYRNYQLLKQKQSDIDPNKIDDFRVSSYINYQGDKLVGRFNAYSYWLLSKALDTHNIARERGGIEENVLKKITIPTLVVGITSDILCPIEEQIFIAENMPHANFVAINSEYGHDGFLIEYEKIGQAFLQWQSERNILKV